METGGLQAFATHRGLALQGPGGVIFLTNHQLAAVAEFAIALQDLIPDPDVEPDGDELDGTRGEDDFVEHPSWGGAGCPIADPGGCEHDGREQEEA